MNVTETTRTFLEFFTTAGMHPLDQVPPGWAWNGC
jgi:hypothetical protein